MPVIHTLRLGTCNTYLIRGPEGILLVDAGNRNKGRIFAKRLKNKCIRPEEIRRIIITHVHFDHVGSCHAIKLLTHARVLAHEAESALLKKGIAVIPPGIAPLHRIASFLGNRYFKDAFHFPPCPVDITISGRASLEDFGIEGIVLPTPGHTKGSLSVILKNGKAFVGDLMVNYLPFGIGHYLPPYGENIPRILNSWETLLRAGVKTFYPGHGPPIPAARLLAALNTLRRRLHA